MIALVEMFNYGVIGKVQRKQKLQTHQKMKIRLTFVNVLVDFDLN